MGLLMHIHPQKHIDGHLHKHLKLAHAHELQTHICKQKDIHSHKGAHILLSQIHTQTQSHPYVHSISYTHHVSETTHTDAHETQTKPHSLITKHPYNVYTHSHTLMVSYPSAPLGKHALTFPSPIENL